MGRPQSLMPGDNEELLFPPPPNFLSWTCQVLRKDTGRGRDHPVSATSQVPAKLREGSLAVKFLF